MNRRDTTYYYKKRSPVKSIVLLTVILLLSFAAFWYYTNYFKTSVAPLTLEKTSSNIFSLEGSFDNIFVSYADEGATFFIGEESHRVVTGDVISESGEFETTSGRLAVLYKDGSEVRLDANTSLSLATDETRTTVVKGRAYFDGHAQAPIEARIGFPITSAYRTATVSGGSFDIRFISPSSAEIVALDERVLVTVFDNEGVVASARLDLYERAVINTGAGKYSLIRVYDFDQNLLQSDDWYVWNKNFVPQIQEVPEAEEITVIESDSLLELAASEKESGILLTWAPYDQANFKRYEILRSSTTKNLTYGRSDSIKTSTTRSLNSFMDYETDPQTDYYYRVCVITLEEEVVCGNSASIKRIFEREREDKESVPTPSVLSATVSAGGILLEWSRYSGDDLSEYLIVRSQTNASPSPAEPIATSSSTRYTDLTVGRASPGDYYYRVCTKNTPGHISCSNVVQVSNGIVQ